MIKLAILAAACLLGSMAMSMTPVLDKPYYDLENAEKLFHDFVKQYKKSYNRKEYFERLEVFKETLRNINDQNTKCPETVFAVNHFADLKPEERQQNRGFRPTNETGVKVAPASSLGLPSSFDWREKGVVTHVKYQDKNKCSSGYIFSAIGNIEGQYAIKHNQSIALSEGQAVDCLKVGLCQGGFPDKVMKEISERAGLMKEEDYPYTPKKGTCHEDIKKVVVHVQGGQTLDIHDEDTLMNKLVEIGPLAVVCLVGSIAMVLDKPYYDLENAGNLFHDFVKEHQKSYNRMEYFERLKIFKETLRNINSQNAKQPETVFAVNRFADLTSEERQKYRGFRPTNETGVKVAPASSLGLPSSFDWREKGVVTHVKDQDAEHCGSCYIFSALGNIEGQYAIKHNQCIALSEGQALDCLKCGWCSGGWPHKVMTELSGKAGLMKEEDYPYIPHKGTCHEDIKKVAVHVQGGQKLDIHDEDTLMNKLVEIGPLAVAISAGLGFSYYESGILHPNSFNCDTFLTHAVVLVGYGEEKSTGTKYWIIKNSYGEKWGEKGYVRLMRGVNACQIGTGYTASAIVA